MPTIHREGSYKFRFYSNENNEPPHIHVWSTEGQMKVWLNEDLEIENCYNIPRHEWKTILEIISKQRKIFLKKWYDFKKRENR
jgi:hypothetical protein